VSAGRKPQPSPAEIFRELRRLAPDIAFSLFWDENPTPLPIAMTQEYLDQMLKEGYREHAIQATALAVVDEQVHEGTVHMTGFFYKPGELDPDLFGWLPHLLWNAAISLANDFKDGFSQAEAAIKYLDGIQRARGR